MQKKLGEFITKIPKSDLHVHLDGSVRLTTLIALSKKQKLSLPSFTTAGLNTLVFKNHYKNLAEYLQGFGYVIPIMQTPENLEQISYEFAWDNINEGVCYVEVRFAPQLHINKQQNIDQVLLSINRGLNKAKAEYNQKIAVQSGEALQFDYGIIVCAMRYFTKEFSSFFARQLAITSNPNTVFAKTSYQLVKSCIKIRDKYGLPIVALDLAGAEAGHPPGCHKKAYHLAHKNLMNLTVHAGEDSGPESIQQAVTELYPERIGHGFYLFASNKITAPNIKNKAAYIKQLVEYLAKQQITIEVCLTSNTQTVPMLEHIKNHSFAQMLTNQLSIAICTDNRTVSKTDVTKELIQATQHFNLLGQPLKNLIIAGFEKSFYPGSYLEKCNYISKAIKRYDYLAKQYFGVK